MLSPLEEADLLRGLPYGIPVGTDTGALATGTLTGLDANSRMVQVSVADSDPLWVPALAAVYTPGVTVRLLRSPLDGGRLTLCLGPNVAGPLIVGGTVTAINSTDGVMTVAALGGSYTLPYNAGTYSVGTKVHVLRDAGAFGAPVHVLGTQGNYVPPATGVPGGGSENPAQLTDREAVIQPQWSGSWRSSAGRYGSWNVDRFGGPSTLYQGNAYGSGPMTGLAVYGDQIVGLNAVQITRMQVNVYRADNSSSSAIAPTLQPATNGSAPSGAPSTTGATVNGPGIAPGGFAQVDLPSSVFETFRTGGAKGLAMVGSTYAGFLGTSRGDGMAIKVQYKVRA